MNIHPKKTDTELDNGNGELSEQILNSSATPGVAHETGYLFVHIDVLMQLIAADQTKLLQSLLEKKVEYLDCKESPEQNWGNCICTNAEAVPTSVIEDAIATQTKGKAQERDK